MYKVLVADDEKLEREALLDILSRNYGREMELYEAENGRNAARVAVLRSVDLVLLDIEMPGINGIEAARSIKEQLPYIRIIFITAYSRFDYAQDAIRLGANDYIIKPFSEQAVLNAINLALEQIDVQRKLAELMPVASAREEPKDETTDDDYDPQMAQVILQVREYLRRNYMNAVSLDSISEILRISPSYLSTQFKRYAHINFVDYLTDLRINEAQDLLKDPLRSTAEVASLVGYEDASYFTRVFKKRTGQTPTQYRRAQANISMKGENG